MLASQRLAQPAQPLPGTRIVLVTFAPGDRLSGVSTEELGIRIDSRVVGGAALGSAERGYCPGSVVLQRNGTGFAGHCFESNIGGIEVAGPNLTAGFIVPNEIPLGHSQLLIRSLTGALGMK